MNPNISPTANPGFTNVSAPENTNNVNQAQNQWANMLGLSQKVTRIRFIRKVYLILTAQLIFTFGLVSVFVFV